MGERAYVVRCRHCDALNILCYRPGRTTTWIGPGLCACLRADDWTVWLELGVEGTLVCVMEEVLTEKVACR